MSCNQNSALPIQCFDKAVEEVSLLSELNDVDSINHCCYLLRDEA